MHNHKLYSGCNKIVVFNNTLLKIFILVDEKIWQNKHKTILTNTLFEYNI